MRSDDDSPSPAGGASPSFRAMHVARQLWFAGFGGRTPDCVPKMGDVIDRSIREADEESAHHVSEQAPSSPVPPVSVEPQPSQGEAPKILAKVDRLLNRLGKHLGEHRDIGDGKGRCGTLEWAERIAVAVALVSAAGDHARDDRDATAAKLREAEAELTRLRTLLAAARDYVLAAAEEASNDVSAANLRQQLAETDAALNLSPLPPGTSPTCLRSDGNREGVEVEGAASGVVRYFTDVATEGSVVCVWRFHGDGSAQLKSSSPGDFWEDSEMELSDAIGDETSREITEVEAQALLSPAPVADPPAAETTGDCGGCGRTLNEHNTWRGGVP
jgi:hypothetical protein